MLDVEKLQSWSFHYDHYRPFGSQGWVINTWFGVKDALIARILSLRNVTDLFLCVPESRIAS